MEEVINRLKTFLDCDGSSLNAIARKAGIDPGNFGKMMDGKQTITDTTLRKIADAHGVRYEWLKRGDGDMFPPEVQQQAISGDRNTSVAGNGNSVNGTETLEDFRQQLREKDQQIRRLFSLLEERDAMIRTLMEKLEK